MREIFLLQCLTFGLGILVALLAAGIAIKHWQKTVVVRLLFVGFVFSLTSFPFSILVFWFYDDSFDPPFDVRERCLWFFNWYAIVYPLITSGLLLLFVTEDRQSSGTKIGMHWRVEEKNPAKLVALLRRREWCFLIESVLLLGFLVLFAYAGGFLGKYFENRGLSSEWMTRFAVIFVFVYAGYILARDSYFGLGPVKSWMNIRVVNFADGRPIGLAKSVVRNAIYLIPLSPVVELVVASVRKDKRRLGDLIANTVVVSGPHDFEDGVEVVPEYSGNEKDLAAEKESTPDPFA